MRQFLQVKRGKHSEKPEEVAERIYKMFPEQQKIELFSRKKRDGWDSWGLDVMDKTTYISKDDEDNQQTLF